jgi:hypothetical protein
VGERRDVSERGVRVRVRLRRILAARVLTEAQQSVWQIAAPDGPLWTTETRVPDHATALRPHVPNSSDASGSTRRGPDGQSGPFALAGPTSAAPVGPSPALP